MNTHKLTPIWLATLLLVGTSLLFVFMFLRQESIRQDTLTAVDTPALEPTSSETMDVVVYLQDKGVAAKSDCGVTYPVTIQVQKTVAVADASLRYLFANELVQYGTYESVSIRDGVAKVTISNDGDPTDFRISALSSCQSGHLLSVLQATLQQYESITSVELYSPTSKIKF